jgi:hypothetical protein
MEFPEAPEGTPEAARETRIAHRADDPKRMSMSAVDPRGDPRRVRGAAIAGSVNHPKWIRRFPEPVEGHRRPVRATATDRSGDRLKSFRV